MYISRFPSLSLRQLVNFNKPNQFERSFDPAKTVYYYRGANAVFNAVKALGLKSEDTVLMPAYHCGIEVEAVLKAGCQVKFYGVTPNLEINWNDLYSQVSPQTKALFIIHYFGFPQDMEKVRKICEEKKLFLIEDCAHALMSSFQGILLGKSGDVSIFSFQKSLGIPDGGALVVRGENLVIPQSEGKPTFLTTLRGIVVLGLQHKHMFYAWCYAFLNLIIIAPARWILRFLKKRQPNDFEIQTASTAVFDSDHASLGMSLFSSKQIQSSNLEVMRQKRRGNFERLRSFLPKAFLAQMIFPSLLEDVCPLFLPVRFSDRKKVKEFLERRGIETFVFGEFLHKNLPQGQYVDAERGSREILCMPIHQDMNEHHVEFLGQALREFYAGRLT